jgi:hypothetical protein
LCFQSKYSKAIEPIKKIYLSGVNSNGFNVMLNT